MRQILSHSRVYDAYQNLVGARRSRLRWVRDYVRPGPRDAVLDVGCGTGAIIEFLPPDVRYVGYDLSPEYVTHARRVYGGRGVFHCGDVADAPIGESPEKFDRVITFGVLHHLDDARARTLIESAHRQLRPGGALVTIDPAWCAGQSAAARFIISRDRGEHVRPAEAYAELARAVFADVTLDVRHDMLRIPFTHAILRCVKD